MSALGASCAALLREEGGLIGAAARSTPGARAPPATSMPAAIAADGPARARPARGVRAADRGDLRGLPAALRRRARASAAPDADLAPAGRRPALRARTRAAGRRSATSTAVRELADTITLSALAQAAGDAGARRRRLARRRARRRLGGERAPTRAPRSSSRARRLAAAALEAMRTSAERRPGRPTPGRIVASLRPTAYGRPEISPRTQRVMATKRDEVKSKYTLDRGIPGAFEGETVTRRRFMTVSVAGRPAGSPRPRSCCRRSASPSARSSRSTPHRWQDRRHRRHDSPTTTTSRSSSRSTPGIGEAGKSTAYVRKHNPAIDTDPPRPHHAVHRDLQPLRAPRLPGALGRRRRALHLPLPRRRLRPARTAASAARRSRPLDRFYTRVIDGDLSSSAPRFSVNSQLRRFSPRDPGRAARRHRPVPLSVAPRRPQAARSDPPRTACPSSPPPVPAAAEGAAAAARRGATASGAPVEHAKEAGITVVDWVDERTSL